MKEKLKNLRKKLGLSQRDVSKAIGVSKSAYSNYEQGIREPSNEILIALCKFYDVSADYLLGLSEEE